MCCGVAPVAACGLDGIGVELHAADVDATALCTAPGSNAPSAARCTSATSTTRCRAGLRGRVDVLAANAPYVPTDRIADDAARGPRPRAAAPRSTGERTASTCTGGWRPGRGEWLAPGGVLLVETSPAQAAAHDRGHGCRRA